MISNILYAVQKMLDYIKFKEILNFILINSIRKHFQIFLSILSNFIYQ
jgi:hypothetical protein